MKAIVLRSAASLERSWKRRGGPLGQFVDRLDELGVPYLSHSKLVSVERCPYCYYREYILCEREEFPAMRLGNLFHAAAKRFYIAFRSGVIAKPPTLLKQHDANAIPADSVAELRNSLILLRDHCWEGHEVVSIEMPFFMDLAAGLPPVIGVPDLVLRRHGSLVLVDHKTSRSFHDCDPAQLVLYAEHLRREHGHDRIVGAFDEYRLVGNLGTIRKPAFRRTPVCVHSSLLAPLIQRYRKAWQHITDILSDGEPPASPDCWACAKRGL